MRRQKAALAAKGPFCDLILSGAGDNRILELSREKQVELVTPSST
jgi:hypothetical protein